MANHRTAVAIPSNHDVGHSIQESVTTSFRGTSPSMSAPLPNASTCQGTVTPTSMSATRDTSALEPFTKNSVLNVPYAHTVRHVLRDKYELCSSKMSKHLLNSFNKFNIDVNFSYPPSIVTNDSSRAGLNWSLIEGLGQLVTKANLSLEDLVRTVRNQHSQDTRPNKRLDPVIINYLYKGTTHHELMVQIAQHGFDPVFCHPEPIQRNCPSNHKSAVTNLAAVTKFIRAGQDDGSLLVLPAAFMEKWRKDPSCCFHTSPLGVVPKKNEVTATDGRVIMDLSWPRNASLNDYTMRDSVPVTEWTPATEVGRRIHELSIKSGWDPLKPENSKIYAFIGDVNAAFRNIPTHAKHVKWFGFFVPELNVIVFDMSAPFGWTASPMYYGVFGNGISAVVRRESPHDLNPHLSKDTDTFFCYEWVDDYILLELNTPGRLTAAETALRLAMTLSLGPTAIHPKKFADTWKQLAHYLGLDWCLKTCTVSMPRIKIDKAIDRVNTLLASHEVTKNQLEKLIGSLRHVSTCIPAARPFFQRLQASCRIPRGLRLPVSEDMKTDCEWFKEILHLGQLESVPVSIFADVSDPDLHLYMDASDAGLVVMNLMHKQYIHIEFDSKEREAILRFKAKAGTYRRGRPANTYRDPDEDEFSINVREFFSVALAVLIWGHTWSSTNRVFHVKAWIDNAAAVSWCNKLASPNRYGQELLRVMGLHLSRYRIHLSANHMPGSWNFMPDAGSRSISDNDLSKVNDLSKIWSAFINSWTRVQVPTKYRYCYKWNSQTNNSKRWPQPHAAITQPHGQSGPPGVTKTTTQANSIVPNLLNPSSCLNTFNSFSTTQPQPTKENPSCPKSALLAGVIRPSLVSQSDYPLDIASPLMAWLAPVHQLAVHNQSTPPYFGPTIAQSSKTLHHHETMLFGAAWSSPTSSACVLANTPALQPKPITTSVFRTCPSLTREAVTPVLSKTLKPYTYSSEAARTIGLGEDAPERFTAPDTTSAVRSSLRGACALLASS